MNDVDARPRSLGGHHFLTTTGAADTRGCQLCCPGNPAGGYTESGLRLSWSSREHRQSHHPTPYYGMRKAKFRRIARTGILMICDELTQSPLCSCVSIEVHLGEDPAKVRSVRKRARRVRLATT